MQGQVALVTGGSRGIGLAAARALAASGCSCALLGRNRGAVEAAAAAIGGSGHTGLSCDVSDNQAVDRAVREVASTYGKINHLVHSAGASCGGGELCAAGGEASPLLPPATLQAFLATPSSPGRGPRTRRQCGPQMFRERST